MAEEVQSLGGTDYLIASRPFAALLAAEHRPFPLVPGAGFAMADVQVRGTRAESALCAAHPSSTTPLCPTPGVEKN